MPKDRRADVVLPDWLNASEPVVWKQNKGAAKDEIVKRIERGLPLSSFVFPKDPSMPTYTTVMSWLKSDSDFKTRYDEARKVQAQLWVDQAMELVSTPPWKVQLSDEMEAQIESGEVSPIVAQGLLRAAVTAEMRWRDQYISQIRWLAARVLPALYGIASKGSEEEGAGGGEGADVVEIELFDKKESG